MATASIAAIKPSRVGDQKMTHKLAKIGMGGLNYLFGDKSKLCQQEKNKEDYYV
jgi:hypothetical protein